MRIIVKRLPNAYEASLYLDGEFVVSMQDKRPGCAIRLIMNRLLNDYGHPTEDLVVDIDGW